MSEDRQDRNRIQSEETDTEFSQEVSAPREDAYVQPRNVETDRGMGWGITGITLAILSFFLWPYLLAPLGIIFGVVSVSQRAKIGWWAIGIGVIALVLTTIFMIFAIPFRILF